MVLPVMYCHLQIAMSMKLPWTTKHTGKSKIWFLGPHMRIKMASGSCGIFAKEDRVIIQQPLTKLSFKKIDIACLSYISIQHFYLLLPTHFTQSFLNSIPIPKKPSFSRKKALQKSKNL